MGIGIATVISAIVALIGSAIGTAVTNKASKKNTDKQIDAEKSLMNQQVASQQMLNESQRSFEVQYNSPANQRKLREQAGLSPYTMDGGGYVGSVSSSAGSASGGSASQAQTAPLDLSSIFSTFIPSMLDAAKLPSEIAKNDATTDNLNQDTVNKGLQGILLQDEHAMNGIRMTVLRYDAENKRLLNIAQALENQWSSETIESRIAAGNFSGKQAALNYEIALKELQAKDFYVNKMQPLEAEKMYGEIRHVTAMTACAWAQEEATRLGMELTQAEIVSAYRMADMYATMNEGYKLDNIGKSWDNKLKAATFGYNVQQSEYAAKQAKRDYGWTPVRNISKTLAETAGAVGDVIGSLYGIKGLGKGAVNAMGLGDGARIGRDFNQRGWDATGGMRRTSGGLYY